MSRELNAEREPMVRKCQETVRNPPSAPWIDINRENRGIPATFCANMPCFLSKIFIFFIFHHINTSHIPTSSLSTCVCTQSAHPLYYNNVRVANVSKHLNCIDICAILISREPMHRLGFEPTPGFGIIYVMIRRRRTRRLGYTPKSLGMIPPLGSELRFWVICRYLN